MRSIWVFLLLLLLSGLVHFPGLQGSFVYDDELQILRNPFVQEIDLSRLFTGSTFSGEGSEKPSGVYYKPLMSVAYGILWKVSAGKASVFHIFQWLLAVTNAFLFYLLLRSWVRPGLALGAATLFLLHPINSEVLLYIADLQDVLYLFWGLIALRLLQRQVSMLWIAGAVLFSSLSKETGLLFAGLVPVFAYFCQRSRWKACLGACGLSFSLYLFLRFGVAGMSQLTGPTFPISQASWEVRWLTFPNSVYYYFRTFLWPFGSSSITLQQNWLVTEISWQKFVWPLIFLGMVAGALLLLWQRSRGENRRILVFFQSALMFNLALHSNLWVPLDATVATRWFYLGSWALLGMAAVMANQFLESQPRFQKVFLSGGLIVILIFAGRSHLRSREWQSGMNLFLAETRSQPDDPRFHNSLALEYLKLNDLDSAEKSLRQSVKWGPGASDNWNNLGTVFERRGQIREAEMSYIRSLQNGPYALAVENYARLLLKQGRFQEARELLKEGLRFYPAHPVLLQLQMQSPSQ